MLLFLLMQKRLGEVLIKGLQLSVPLLGKIVLIIRLQCASREGILHQNRVKTASRSLLEDNVARLMSIKLLQGVSRFDFPDNFEQTKFHRK